MARYCGEKNPTVLLGNAKQFQQRCLVDGKSLFTDLPIWTLKNCNSFAHYFIDNPDEGDDDFFQKLEGQLASASTEVKMLAAEMLWLMFLCPSNTGPQSKRQSIERVISWTGIQIDPAIKTKYLSDDALSGVGNAGVAYNTGRWRELNYCIRVAAALLNLSPLQRLELFNNHEIFAQWLEAIPENESRQFRHMLLFMFFPDFHERLFGSKHRQTILLKLANISNKEYKKLSCAKVDQELLKLREKLEVELGRIDIDFYEEPLKSKWMTPDDIPSHEVAEPTKAYAGKVAAANIVQLNRILYGPPGTGKTYNTINEALEIVDPDYLAKHGDDRSLLKARFDELLEKNRIGFVTFHQSFSYEDFVEGLKASSEGNALTYHVVAGVFKSLCERATLSYSNSISVDDFDAALLALQQAADESDSRIEMETVRGRKFEIEYAGGLTFKVFPHATESVDPKYVASIANVKKLYLTGSKKDIYNTSYVEGFLLYLKKHFGLKDYVVATTNQLQDTLPEPYVLIIDEINRGNISNIFGELITLIEPSKRAGGSEAITVKLPYSKEGFSVPSNLYIIGTMNTADKSLAQLDIALRRRFEFVEMMPKPSLLGDIDCLDIDFPLLLKTINQRIELLYDREHTIGHSFFMPLKDDPTIERLARIFELEILPLLEEYFFEDWERVGQVLGDHLKKDNSLKFFHEKYSDEAVARLMGNHWGSNGVRPYVRNRSALLNPMAYIGIYDALDSE